MRSFIIALALTLTFPEFAYAELQTAVVLLRTPGSEPQATLFLDGVAETGSSNLATVSSRLQSIQGQGSYIYLWIDTDDRTPWSVTQQIIDAAQKNDGIKIKSVRAGSFIRSHEEMVGSLQPTNPMDRTRGR
jgi:hypothetical protein